MKLIIFIGLLGPVVTLEASHKRDLFSDFVERPQHFYVCEDFGGGLKYQFPEIVDCPTYTNIKEQSKAVSVTAFFIDNDKIIEAVYCHSNAYRVDISRNFWGQDSESKLDLGPLPISHKDCIKMRDMKISPAGQELVRLRDGQFSTHNHFKPDPFWTTTQTQTNANYFIDNYDVGVEPGSGLIRSGVPTTRACNIAEGQCPTDMGMLIWVVPEHPFCNLKEGKTSTCLQIADRITCPETEFLFTGVIETKICGGLTVAISEQNVILASQGDGDLTKNSASTKEIRKYFSMLNSTSNREKRGTSDAAWTKAHYVTDEEVNLKESFIYSVVEKGHNFDIQNIANDLCRAKQNIYLLARYLVEIGQPSAIARLVTRDLGVRAKLIGDVISIWECPKVTRYFFLPRNECIAEWPIRYIIGNDHRTGYLRGYIGEIVKTPTYVNCPPDQFYVQMGGELMLLGNKTATIHKFPSLPISVNYTSPTGLRDLALKAKGEHTRADAYGTFISQNVVKSEIMEQTINAVIIGHPLSTEQAQYLSSVQSLMTAPFSYQLHFAITVVGGFILFIILLIVGQNYKAISTAFKSILQAITSVFVCLKRLTECGRQISQTDEEQGDTDPQAPPQFEVYMNEHYLTLPQDYMTEHYPTLPPRNKS